MSVWGSLLFGILCAGAVNAAPASTPSPFRLHLVSEPQHLDPHRLRSAASSYLQQSLHRGLLSYDDDKGLVPALAESCTRSQKGLRLTCRLRENLRWSDGSALTAQDFVLSFRRLLTPQNQSPRADLLFAVKGAKDVLRGALPPEKLGIRASDPRSVIFELENSSPDFEYNLTTSQTAVVKPDNNFAVVSGPYQVENWEKGRKLRLKPNPHFLGGHPRRPPVEFLFIEDDGVALRLYEKGDLDFLRRLPTLYITKWKTRTEFHWIPMLRFDYLGFGPRLRGPSSLREAFATSPRFEELQKLFHSEGKPGCAGLPDSWFASGKAPCLVEATAPSEEQRKNLKALSPLSYHYSTQGGEDHRRAAEWLQDQWQKKLQVRVQTKGIENKIFLSQLKDSPPDLFRKGLALDRPTCHAALETFLPDHPENHLHFDDKDYVSLVQKLEKAQNEKDRRNLCEQAVNKLLSEFRLIPLGAMHFAVLAKPQWQGWRLNGMGQMDLSQLRFVD